ncbi:MAG: hypothetical protein ABH836_00245 [Candidatus Omnitrophota bacterium]
MRNIVALGAESKSSFSVISRKGFYYDSLGGNLREVENFKVFENRLRKYINDNRIPVDCIVCDTHPDYFSTRLAEKLLWENKKAQLLKVQHHFAHAVSCMFDNDIDEEVCAVIFDGTGFGSDGNWWGSELLICDRKNYRRVKSLEYIHQPGADIAAKESWRMALAYLLKAYGNDFNKLNPPLFDRIGNKKISFTRQMIEKDINCPLTSSMGRLFDAVSSIIGLCDVCGFEAEAAILLEKEAVENINDCYGYEITENKISVLPMIRQIVEDLSGGMKTGVISAKFHNTIGEIVFETVRGISNVSGIKKIVVSGGCFQNNYLMNYIEKRFLDSGLELFKHNKYSTTDLGVSVGQAVIATM